MSSSGALGSSNADLPRKAPPTPRKAPPQTPEPNAVVGIERAVGEFRAVLPAGRQGGYGAWRAFAEQMTTWKTGRRFSSLLPC